MGGGEGTIRRVRGREGGKREGRGRKGEGERKGGEGDMQSHEHTHTHAHTLTEWSEHDVVEKYLKPIKMDHFAKLFTENHINGAVLLALEVGYEM